MFIFFVANRLNKSRRINAQEFYTHFYQRGEK